MSLLYSTPDWMSYFRITVVNSKEDCIFDSFGDGINVLRFENTLGAKIGEYLRIGEDKFCIIDIQLYCDGLGIQNKPRDKFGVQVNIIVDVK